MPWQRFTDPLSTVVSVRNAKRRLAASSMALALILAGCGINDGESPARDLTAQELELMDAFEADHPGRAYDLLNAPTSS